MSLSFSKSKLVFLSSKNLYLVSLTLIFGVGLASLFYYSHNTILSQDEAGYWFNFTDKSFENRSIPNFQIPNHTISIYMAKLSLIWFGNHGIGYRFPVIFFGVLSAIFLFIFIKRFWRSTYFASLASALLFLLPWYLHYSHELRGYPPYMFFAIGAYYCFYSMLEGNPRRYSWLGLLVSFIGAYYSNLGAIIFIFVFMLMIWILKLIHILKPEIDRLSKLENLPLIELLLFSGITLLVFIYIVWFKDRWMVFWNFNERSSFAQYFTLKSFLIGVLDIFSSYLGYFYLQEMEVMLFNYPAPLFLFNLVCFVSGVVIAFRSKKQGSIEFLVLLALTIIFVLFMGFNVQVRALVYLLPFIVSFQALGLGSLIKVVVKKLRRFLNPRSGVLVFSSLFLITWSLILQVGKYKKTKIWHGNSYEKTLDYLKKHAGKEDLIISDLRETVGGFYLGDLMREKVKNIYYSGKIKNIYLLTNKENLQKVLVPDYDGKAEFIKAELFKKVVSFNKKNHQLHWLEKISIFKSERSSVDSIFLSANFFSTAEIFSYSDNLCKKKIGNQGLKIDCGKSAIAYSSRLLELPFSVKEKKIIVIVNMESDFGSMSINNISLTNLKLGPNNKNSLLMASLDSKKDLDRFRKNVEFWAIFHQELETSQSMIQFLGKLTQGDISIKGIRVISLEN